MSEFTFSTLCVIVFLVISAAVYEKMNVLRIYQMHRKYRFKIAVVCGRLRSKNKALLKKLNRACPNIIILFDDSDSPVEQDTLSCCVPAKSDADVFLIRKSTANENEIHSAYIIEDEYKIYSEYSIMGYNGTAPDIDTISNFEKLENFKIIAMRGVSEEISAQKTDIIIALKEETRLVSLPLIGKMIISRDGIHFCIHKNVVTIPEHKKKTEISFIKV